MSATTPTGDPPPYAAMPVAFNPGPTEDLPVALDARALARQRSRARIAEARAYEQLGQRVLKFKAKKFGVVGEYIVTNLGVKKVGHGTIISASEYADQSIQRCDALVQELLAKDPPCDPDVIVALMTLKKDFNQQLLDSGEAHLRIDRQPTVGPESNTLSVPFPAGTPMLIAVGKQPPPPAPVVESDEPTV